VFKNILVILLVATTLWILIAGCEDSSENKLVKTKHFWLSGPSKSVDKLQRLYNLDVIAEEVAEVVGQPVAEGRITLLNGWEFFDVCPKSAEACVIGNDMYLQTGYAVSNVMGLVIAHEMSHYYTSSELAAERIACEVFPEYPACDKPGLPRIN